MVSTRSWPKSREDEESRTLADTDEARFDRLLRAASTDPDALAWVETAHPDTDFNEIGIGAMVSWECDLYLPDVVQALARPGEALEAIGMMQSVLPMAKRLGLDTEGLPNEDGMAAVAGFVSGLNAKLLVVGEDDQTDWQIAGQLASEYLHGAIEGRARVVGKVFKILQAEQWKPYLTFPGMNLLPREERRKLERQPPEPGKEDQYLSGPALILDLLAIYH